MANFSENPTTDMPYRKFDDDTTISETDIPLRPENRKRTDSCFFVVFIIVILTLVPFLVYTLMHSDIKRLHNSIREIRPVETSHSDDDMETDSDTDIYLSNNDGYIRGVQVMDDMRRRQQELEDMHKRLQNAQQMMNDFKLPENYGEDVSTDDLDNGNKLYSRSRFSRSVTWTKQKEREIDFSVLGWRLAFATFLPLGFCIILANLFRYATGPTVWGILILGLLGLIALTGYYCSNERLVGTGIVLAIITLVYLCMLLVLRNKIRLAIMLFKEATKATFQMHMIFAVPALIVVLTLMIAVAYFTTTVFMNTAGYPTSYGGYHPDNWMIAAIILNSCVTLWVVEFLAGIQYMVIGGAVTKWYFSRNKDNLGSPVFTSLYVTIKYHLGTAALGSLIITLVMILRAILRGMMNNHRLRWLVMCFMSHIEGFLRFFTKNSYIVTAMHGTPFIKSGKQAVKLLTLNVCNTITVNSIGDYVIFISSFFVVSLSLLTAYLVMPEDQVYTTSALVLIFYYLFVLAVAVLCCVTILGTFETAFSTLFLCVCQDFLINNGEDKPYAMTRDLMEYLQASKKLYSDKIQEKNLPTI